MSAPRSARPARPVALGAGLLVAVLAGGAGAPGPVDPPPQYGPGGRTNLFDGAVAWVNTATPIRSQDLIGKVVLLDFWTYCCINCHHVIPDLERLEKKYPDALVVIGVHSPKFEAERDTENIRKKVREYEIKHPVANDANMVLWRRFNANVWPTLAIIDARGNLRGAVTGEGNYEKLDEFIGKLVEEHRRKGELDETPFVVYAESDRPSDGPLLFPGKVLADQENNRLFISDTGHNRIVATDLEGKGLFTVGGGEQGLKDGPFDAAQFNRPQGMCRIGESLYVADTENHAIRRVDLTSKMVETIAGNGEQSYQRRGSGPAADAGLNSPWDLLQVPGEDVLIVAMAGPHQLWKLDLDREIIGVWAGSGREDIIDGTYGDAAFAQPSGLATDGTYVYVADSEVSGVRRVSLSGEQRPQVGRVVGMGLFEFGDRDGTGDRVRLQHCLGLAYGDGKLYIADTYNNKIKVCDPSTRAVETLIGTKQPGSSDTIPNFYQPGGLSLAGQTLFIADTNNHAVRAYDLEGHSTRTLAIEGIDPPEPPPSKPSFARAVQIEKAAIVAPGDLVTVELAAAVPGYKLQPDSPILYLVEAPDDPQALGADVSETGTRVLPTGQTVAIPVPLARSFKAGESLSLQVSASIFACANNGGFCTLKQYTWTLPLTFKDGAESTVAIAPADAEPAATAAN